jgi:hypothetical protein
VVSHRFLTRETRIGPQEVHMVLVVDKVTVGQVLLRVILYFNVSITIANGLFVFTAETTMCLTLTHMIT